MSCTSMFPTIYTKWKREVYEDIQTFVTDIFLYAISSFVSSFSRCQLLVLTIDLEILYSRIEPTYILQDIIYLSKEHSKHIGVSVVSLVLNS